MAGRLDSQELLKQVSRSFYLTLRVLPRSVRGPIGIAYLLARASDTIADTPLLEVSRRRESLQLLRAGIQDACEGRRVSAPDFGDLAAAQATTAGEGTQGERILLERFGELLDSLRTVEREDRARIGKLLDTITRGQESDLMLFGANPDQVVALKSEEELDRYTYQVAGCVGEFWTETCRARVFPHAPLDDGALMSNAIRFGKGLQLVNILRDLPRDLRRGRCYIPRDRLANHGLAPADLLRPAEMERFRPLFNAYVERAEDFLSYGWQYTTSLPYRCARIRLACAWPLLIGASTLEKLRTANILREQPRVKVSRAEIRRLIISSTIVYPFPRAWKRLFEKTDAGEKG